MSLLKKLNETCSIKENVKISTLETGKSYKIVCAVKKTTKYEETILLELEEVCVFFPQRYTRKLDEEGLNQLAGASIKITKYINIMGNASPVIEFS